MQTHLCHETRCPYQNDVFSLWIPTTIHLHLQPFPVFSLSRLTLHKMLILCLPLGPHLWLPTSADFSFSPLLSVAHSNLKALALVLPLPRTPSLQFFTWLLPSHHSDLLLKEESQDSSRFSPSQSCYAWIHFLSDSSVPIFRIFLLVCKFDDSRDLVCLVPR